MTPKQKAQELVDKMLWYGYDEDEECYREFATECALIAVDEVIKVATLIKVGLELDYWEQVKIEIIKL